MSKNPYVDTLIAVLGTVVFIVVSSYLLGAGARLVAAWRGATRRRQSDTFAGYFFAAPWIVGFLIFVVVPMGFSLYWGFTDYRIASGQPIHWVGLRNYVRLLSKDMTFRASLVNTLYLTVIGLPLQLGFSLLLAVLLNQKMRGERLFRIAFYLPVILGFNAAVLLAWRLMLNTGTGIINQVLRAASQFKPIDLLIRAFVYVQELTSAFFLGLGRGNFRLLHRVWEAGFPPPHRVPLWVQSPLWSKMSVVLLMVWLSGTMMLIFLAGLQNIPRELYEAAEVDGANSWQRFWRITLPLLTPYIFYNLIVGLIAALQIFEPIFVLYHDNQPLIPSTISMVYYLWQASFQSYEIGYGSAISWVVMIIILLVTLVQFKLQDRWVTYDIK